MAFKGPRDEGKETAEAKWAQNHEEWKMFRGKFLSTPYLLIFRTRAVWLGVQIPGPGTSVLSPAVASVHIHIRQMGSLTGLTSCLCGRET